MELRTFDLPRYLSVLPLLGVPVHKNFTWLPERKEVSAEVNRKWPAELHPRWIALQPGAVDLHVQSCSCQRRTSESGSTGGI